MRRSLGPEELCMYMNNLVLLILVTLKLAPADPTFNVGGKS
jgi:hypothetical protein